MRRFPSNIKAEGACNGNVDAVNQEENLEGLLYNKVILRKAGIPVPWHPQSWQDIIAAAQKIKASGQAGVIPLWLTAGTESGANGELAGIDNLILGTSEPTIETSSGKEVVDSAGIRSALAFYKQVYSDGLGAPVSTMLARSDGRRARRSADAEDQVGICLCLNGLVTAWSRRLSARRTGRKRRRTTGVAPIPHQTGGGEVSTIGGFDFAVGAHAGIAGTGVRFHRQHRSSRPPTPLTTAIWRAACRPADRPTRRRPSLCSSPPFNREFAAILPHATEAPTGANYTVWAQGMGTATGAIANNPQHISRLGRQHVEVVRHPAAPVESGVTTLP